MESLPIIPFYWGCPRLTYFSRWRNVRIEMICISFTEKTYYNVCESLDDAGGHLGIPCLGKGNTVFMDNITV